MPQFLPTSYLNHGVDGNHDGVISLYDPDDAIPSCAKYLAAHGWKPGITYEQQRRVIWDYNHSDAYIDTVLSMASSLSDADTPVVEVAAPARKRVARKKAAGKTRVAAKSSSKSSKASKKTATAKKSSAKTATKTASTKKSAAKKPPVTKASTRKTTTTAKR
jgi:hypothetical protein